nr:putative ribonuclease H-like domain-containing protein [Tanacetum cinerariifolium]
MLICLGLWYPRESAFDLEAYSDSDYAGANLDRKSTTGGCQFLDRRFISWQCKKQTIVATLTTKAKYVAAASCCGQVLWIQNKCFSKMSSLGKEHVSKQGRKKAKTRTNIDEDDFNKLDDLVDEGVDYVVNEGRSTDKIKVLSAEAEGVSAASVQPVLLSCFKNQKAKMGMRKFFKTKWILKNKRDARVIVYRNKARLVAQGHRQEKGIDYTEVFAPATRVEAIRLFLAFASYMGFMVYQMDVKSAFLNGEIQEEVYVTQSKGFEDPKYPKRVYKVVKALYGLYRALRAWYATLSSFLLKHGYRRGTIDQTLFLKKDSKDIILVQVYVDDIIFGSTRQDWSDEFEALMQSQFEMSSMGHLTFFLGLQVDQRSDGIFIHQTKYVNDILHKLDMDTNKSAPTPFEPPKIKDKNLPDGLVNVHLYRSMIGSLMYLTASRPDITFAVSACARNQVSPTISQLNDVKRIFKYIKGHPKLGLWYLRDSPFDLEAFSDSDYAGAVGDRKSTTGGCQFMGRRLISWQCKKQTIVATSSCEAEYVAAALCCGQVLWIQNQLLDYGFNFMNTKIYIDNQSTISIVKNPVFHQRTKHIEIRHHFIRDANEKKLIQVLKIHYSFCRFKLVFLHSIGWNSCLKYDLPVVTEKLSFLLIAVDSACWNSILLVWIHSC